MVRYKIRLRIIRKKFRYWYPGANFVKDLIDKYGKHIENNDILVLSEKALAVALGSIHDESTVRVDIFTKILTYVVTKVFWLKLLRFLFKRYETLDLLNKIPIEVLSAHKKVALRYGGVKHFLKPVSEGGIDATNLPYSYVSIPPKRLDDVLDLIRLEVFKRLKKHVNVLVIDTDKSFRPRFFRNIVFATRASKVKGVIDFGAYAYILGKALPNLFTSYPTPVAYSGIDMGLARILKIAKICEKIIGHGFGRNALEMLKTMNKKDFSDITWLDMAKLSHYPALLVKIRVEKYT